MGTKRFVATTLNKLTRGQKRKISMSRLSIFSSILILSLFATTSFTTVIPVAKAATSSADWPGVDGNYPYNYNYSPQTTINAQNVQTLQMRWVFPVPPHPPNYGSDGIIITPIVVHGYVYAVTNYWTMFAWDARTGAVLWSKALPNVTFGGLLVGMPTSGHFHAIWYTEKIQGKPLVWAATNNYTVVALNALTGDKVMAFPYIKATDAIPGNFGKYDMITPTLVFDEQRQIMVAGSSGSEGANSGRGFYAGYDVSTPTPKLLWRTFMIPPQDGSDPNWAIKSVQGMDHAYIFTGKTAVDLKALTAQQLNQSLYNDWGNVNRTGAFGFDEKRSYVGADPAWGGSWAVDQTTGTAYVGTAQPAPHAKADNRTGPNLWSDSVIAIDTGTGRFKWAFQTTAHDLVDWDCAWSVVLANATIGGQTQ